MDRDALYYHLSNLTLILIGLLSIQRVLSPFAAMILIPGTVAGFIVSWRIKDSRLHYKDTFIGMLSLAVVVIILGRLYDTALTFENLLKIFSTTLAWLTFFQSFGLRTVRSYAIIQFISASLLICSVCLALEQETYYIILLTLFLFTIVFTMRLSLICERKNKGSIIVGDQLEILGFTQQLKTSAIIFSLVLIVSSFIYPFVPRFENLSLKWVPSTLFGLSENNPMMRLFKKAPLAIKEAHEERKQQPIDDTKKRETSGDVQQDNTVLERRHDDGEKDEKKSYSQRFPAKEFDKDIDIFKIESLTIRSDKDEMPLDAQCRLKADLKFSDGSSVPAERLVDWKVVGTARLSIGREGDVVAMGIGDATISASYLGSFSNDVHLKITRPLAPIKRKDWRHYLWLAILMLSGIALSAYIIWIFMRGRRLSDLAIRDPRGFVKELYIVLCRGLGLYGARRFDYLAHREYSEHTKWLVSLRPESMHLMTEGVLEARFSAHNISREHSRKALDLFHEVKSAVLSRQEGKEILKKALFRIFILDVLLMPKLP